MAKKKLSAGILLYRRRGAVIEVFLVHPGGPFWARKDSGAWSLPKGLCADGEDPLTAARREFFEETGSEVAGPFHELLPVTQPSGKVVSVWAVEGDLGASTVKSNMFSMEWPPHSGKAQEFPEVDCGEWFDIATAQKKLQQGHRPIIEQFVQLVNNPST